MTCDVDSIAVGGLGFESKTKQNVPKGTWNGNQMLLLLENLKAVFVAVVGRDWSLENLYRRKRKQNVPRETSWSGDPMLL